MAKQDSNTIIILLTTQQCQDDNLSLNVSKSNAVIVDYRKRRAEHTPIHIDGL
jgi:hypothetical protein